jgi:hypothetical protein
MRRKLLAVMLACALVCAGATVVAGPASAAAGDPFGNFETLVRYPGGLRLSGWALDPDVSSPPVDVHVYIDGGWGGAYTANTSRPDVGAANPGKGDNHGFNFTIAYTTSGPHDVCVYAINRPGTPGGNPLLGCRSITVNNNPEGNLDSVSPEPGGLRAQGWAIDPDKAGAINVHIYVDGVIKANVTANVSRPDVGAAYPGWGNNHGYSVFIPDTVGGTKPVKAFGINFGAGTTNAQVGPTRNIEIRTNPQGVIVGTPTQEFGGMRVRGWAIDPSTSAAIDVQIRRYTSPTAFTVVHTGTADAASPAVSSSWTDWGPNHGFDVTIPGVTVAGTTKICAVGINVGSGSNSEFSTCPTPVMGNIATLAVTAPTPSQGLWGTTTLSASVSAGDVDTVEFVVDGNVVASGAGTPYSAEWDTTTVADGAHTILARAKKSGSVVGESAPVTFTVTNAIAISLTGPDEGDATYGTLLLEAAPTAGVSSVEFLVDGNVVGSDTSAPFELEWDSATVGDGFHAVTARAVRDGTPVATADAVTVDVWNCQ